MENKILKNIYTLRNGKPFIPDLKNKNRYVIATEEENGSRTAYCFAVPVYTSGGNLIDLQFHKCDEGYDAEGSSGHINVGKNITLRSADEVCVIMPEHGLHINSAFRHVLHESLCDIVPTTNGLAFKAHCTNGAFRFKLTTENELFEKGNNKYFSLMKDEFYPAITASCIGSADEHGNIIAPALISAVKADTGEYVVSVEPQSPYARFVIFEVNLYEQKLFQDTTTESISPDVNNVYGSTAFIGHTAAFGEQWLYSRPDFGKLRELSRCYIESVILHMSSLRSGMGLCAHRIVRRFCSFGSTWNNKVLSAGRFAELSRNANRMSLDLTELTVDGRSRRLRQPDGFIIKAVAEGGFTAISTGDSFYAPQILEIRYR